MKLRGRDVALYVDDELVALSKSCDITVQCDIQEFTSILSGHGKRFRAGRYSWKVGCEQLYGLDIGDSTESIALLRLLLAGERVQIRMASSLESESIRRTITLSGYAVVTDWSEKAPLQGFAVFSASFTGDGGLDVNISSSNKPRPPING